MGPVPHLHSIVDLESGARAPARGRSGKGKRAKRWGDRASESFRRLWRGLELVSRLALFLAADVLFVFLLLTGFAGAEKAAFMLAVSASDSPACLRSRMACSWVDRHTARLSFSETQALLMISHRAILSLARASAVALTAGASAQTSTGGSGSASAGTDARLNTVTEESYDSRSGMAVFTIAKGGLMYEATLSSQKFKYEPAK